MEAHVHVVFPQDPIADAGRHGRGASVKAAAAAGTRAVVRGGHGPRQMPCLAMLASVLQAASPHLAREPWKALITRMSNR